MLPHGAFRVLLLFIGVSAADVPPPKEVTVSCQNVKVTVSWKYSNHQPQTRFRVNIASSSGDFESNTTEHQVDLSHFIWKSEDHYLDRHYVSVTAIQGGNESKPVESKTFSFNDLKTAHIKCELDFPQVDVNVKDSGATVSFMNPLHFYREVKQANKLDGAYFRFSVTHDGNLTKDDCKCTVKEEICKCDIVFTGAERCVTLNGSLVRGNNVGKVIFKGIDRICGEEQTEMIVFALVLSAIVLVIIVVTILIYNTKAWTMKTPEDLPKSLDLLYNVVRPMEFHPVKLSTVNSEEEKITPTKRLLDSSASLDLQPPADAYTDGHLLESSSQEGHRTDNDSTDDSVKTECVLMDLEEDEEEEGRSRAHYDRRHAIEVDIGDGEMVTGYCERDHLCGHARRLSESSSSQEGHRTDNDSADDSAKTESVSMHLEEGEEEEGWEEGRLLPAHYDRRHAIEVDIGDGEMVTGYCERDLLCGHARHLSESSSSQEGHRTDNDSADDSAKTECVSMDLEEGEKEEEGKEEEEEEEGGLPAHYIRRNR